MGFERNEESVRCAGMLRDLEVRACTEGAFLRQMLQLSLTREVHAG